MEYFTDDKKQIHLIKEIGSGGEGSVYKTDLKGLAAKIYKPEKITPLRQEKLKLMLTKNIDCAGVCFPLAPVYNDRDEFSGYLMREATGKDLGKSVFMPALMKKYFPSWTRKDTVQLCVTILKKLKYLHDRDIILGDINPYNILVASPEEVYFVDTDSWQIEKFICPVGMPLFTAPELQKKSSYGLRTLGNENFAVATLLFMIMLPGKPPYSMQDGKGIVENIIEGDFPYPLEKNKTGKVPKGSWSYCWSHLDKDIKTAFYNTFRYDGKNHDEEKRLGAGDWLQLFEKYLESLKSGKLQAYDEESIKIFPTRLKRFGKKSHAKCKLCGQEYEKVNLKNGNCPDCCALLAKLIFFSDTYLDDDDREKLNEILDFVQSKAGDEIFSNSYLKPFFRELSRGDYPRCYNLYKWMVSEYDRRPFEYINIISTGMRRV